MPTIRQLRDIYRFPGFEPLATVRGFFGDPRAVVITLQRRGKKRPAEYVGRLRRPATINGHVRSATFPAATSAFISTFPFVGSSALGVAA